jgi:hypothetical protein
VAAPHAAASEAPPQSSSPPPHSSSRADVANPAVSSSGSQPGSSPTLASRPPKPAESHGNGVPAREPDDQREPHVFRPAPTPDGDEPR